MVSTGWGTPSSILRGFNPGEVGDKYGDSLYFWSWKERTLKQTVRREWEPLSRGAPPGLHE